MKATSFIVPTLVCKIMSTVTLIRLLKNALCGGLVLQKFTFILHTHILVDDEFKLIVSV